MEAENVVGRPSSRARDLRSATRPGGEPLLAGLRVINSLNSGLLDQSNHFRDGVQRRSKGSYRPTRLAIIAISSVGSIGLTLWFLCLLRLLDFLPELGCRFVVDCLQGFDGAQDFRVTFGFEVEREFLEVQPFQRREVGDFH